MNVTPRPLPPENIDAALYAEMMNEYVDANCIKNFAISIKILYSNSNTNFFWIFEYYPLNPSIDQIDR